MSKSQNVYLNLNLETHNYRYILFYMYIKRMLVIRLEMKISMGNK